MKITTSTVKEVGNCNYCNRHEDKSKASFFPFERVFIVEGKNVRSVFCEDCITELQMYSGAKHYRLVLGFQGGKETSIELGAEPTREDIVKAMELHNADNYRIEYIV